MEITVTTVAAVRSLRVPILMYHEIAPPSQSSSRLAVAPEAFAEQLAYLHEEGCQTVTVAELSAVLGGGERALPDRSVVLTFDDGYADFHTRAMPMMDRYGFRATVFVTTGWVQDAGPLPTGRRPGRMMSWSQVEEAAQARFEVAAHSHLHPQLDRVSPQRLREELHVSKAQLEDKTGSPVTGLAYPFGYSNARVRHAVRELGHGYACAVSNVIMSDRADLLALPRLTVRRSTRIPTFQHLVRGSSLQRIFFKDRALTKGWAVARRSMAALNSVSRDQ
jgi:peptidoglycan/xylan/chitin deacetylase (PgdA/CDA1 family)